MLAFEKIPVGGGPDPQRGEAFRRAMLERFSVALAVEPTGSEPVISEIVAYCGRRLRFAAMEFSPHRTSWVASPDSGRPARLLVSMQRSGAATVCQDGREASVVPGQMFVIDPARSFHIETTRMCTHSVYIDANAVRALVPSVDALTACAIDTATGAGALFRAYADEMFRLAPSFDDATADRVAGALPQVFATALAGLAGPADAPGRLRRLQRREILGVLEAHLRDCTLDVDRIARAVRLSPRRIHEVFEAEPESLMQCVWSMRLERCAAELRAAGLADRSIGHVAYGWGFSSVSHFSRAFRKRYGVSPRQWRSGAGAALTAASGSAAPPPGRVRRAA